ncbi:ABC transporter sub-family G-like protein 1, partial [Dinothrombium tinctorium]
MYTVGVKNIPKSKKIVKSVNGQIEAGNMVAIMGPSGSGKSTLLETIIGKRVSGREGSIVCTNGSKLLMVFVPQHDSFINVLTVRESILFAAKLKLATALQYKNDNENWVQRLNVNDQMQKFKSASKYFKEVTNKLLKEFNLEVCADDRVSVCSGGQLKRLSIAQELVVLPDILILDEPTTGLDSATCL